MRKVFVSDDFIDVAEKELKDRNYSVMEAKAAENWILIGNWNGYKKKFYNLELSDFYPDADQLRSTGQKHIPLQIALEREQKLIHTITRLRGEIERINEINRLNDPKTSLSEQEKELIVDLQGKLMSATSKILTLQSRVNELQTSNRKNRMKTLLNEEKNECE